MNPSPVVAPDGSGPSVRLWGHGAVALHDLFWAEHGVQVVRAGARAALGPRRGVTARLWRSHLYLLLDRNELLLLDPGALSDMPRRGQWRIAVSDRAQDEPRERLLIDVRGRVHAVTREYAGLDAAGAPVVATRSAALARMWSECEGVRSGRTALREGAPGARSRIVLPGARYDGADGGEARAFLADLAGACPDLPRAIGGLTRVAPGVWLGGEHLWRAGSRSAARRLIGPSWIGAGSAPRAAAPLAGARVIPDKWPVPGARLDLRARGRLWVRPDLKRTVDLVLGSAALLIAAPIFPLVMGAIWLEDGRPFFFAHRRQARAGLPFDCLKFRTMRKDAEHGRAGVGALNLCDGPQFKAARDPRVLRVGRLLRRLSLDELPQLFNVLRGEMSLVGPRPSPERENCLCPPWRAARLSVRPGITGLWQVRRTREPMIDFQEWIRYDVGYVERRSLWRDLWILLRTPAAALRPVRGSRIASEQRRAGEGSRMSEAA
jgi:lipopolysaccharide/colanic/teichoic acid biosynthesis glycosyltransferase